MFWRWFICKNPHCKRKMFRYDPEKCVRVLDEAIEQKCPWCNFLNYFPDHTDLKPSEARPEVKEQSPLDALFTRSGPA